MLELISNCFSPIIEGHYSLLHLVELVLILILDQRVLARNIRQLSYV